MLDFKQTICYEYIMKVNTDKQIKTDISIDNLSVSDFNGSIDSVVKFLQDKQTAWQAHGYTNIVIDAYQSYDDVSIELKGDRLETDQELGVRVAVEKRFSKSKQEIAKQKEKTEKALLARLKKKYESK